MVQYKNNHWSEQEIANLQSNVKTALHQKQLVLHWLHICILGNSCSFMSNRLFLALQHSKRNVCCILQSSQTSQNARRRKTLQGLIIHGLEQVVLTASACEFEQQLHFFFFYPLLIEKNLWHAKCTIFRQPIMMKTEFNCSHIPFLCFSSRQQQCSKQQKEVRSLSRNQVL